MTQYSDDLLAEFVLGHLSAADAAGIEAEAARSAPLRATIDELRELLTGVALIVEDASPPAELRERVLSSASKVNRFASFANRVAQLIDVTVDKARQLLAAIDSAVAWEPGLAEGMSLYHLDAGPAAANAVVGFVKLKAGVAFPTHTHIGQETVLILQGRCTDEDGTVSGPGDEVVKAGGTTHFFTTHGDAPDFIYLAVVFEGVQIGDIVMGPDDPNL